MTSIRAVLDPDVELIEPDGIPIGGSYHGIDAVIDDLFPAVAERFPEPRSIPTGISQTATRSSRSER